MLVSISQLVTAVAHETEARQPVVGKGCPLKNFCSHSFDSFDKTSDHVSAEKWLNDMEELLETIGCTNEQKVTYTAFKLNGELKRSWQPRKVLLIIELGSGQAITWKIFKDEFNKHLFPRVL